MARPKQSSNQEILNAIREDASKEYQEKVPVATEHNLEEVAERITEYPTIKNEFIDKLMNKVGKTQFFNKLYNNPLAVLKKGKLPFGKSIEQIFIEASASKAFVTYDDEKPEEFNENMKRLFGKEKPIVKVDYITENFRPQYKITLSRQQLRGAFLEENGLANMLAKSIEAQLTKANHEEYLKIKDLIDDNEMKVRTLENDFSKDLAIEIRTLREELKFISSNFNTSEVNTHTDPSKFVIVTTPRHKAKLDVELLATAFNLDKAELLSRVIVVDTFKDEKTRAVIMDEDYIQVWETLNESGSQENVAGMYINNFLNRWAIMGKCKFCNAVAIKAQ